MLKVNPKYNLIPEMIQPPKSSFNKNNCFSLHTFWDKWEHAKETQMITENLNCSHLSF